jgi:hypothetical protein
MPRRPIPARAAKAVPDADWPTIRRRYEETDAAVADIIKTGEVTRASFDTRRKKEGWRRGKPRGPSPGQRTAATNAAPVARLTAAVALPTPKRGSARRVSKPVTLAGRRKLIDRLVAAISLKLEQLERRMAHDLDADDTGAASSTDHERETRAIGALIDNLGKVTEIASDIARPSGGKSAVAAAELADEADRFRRELAERLSRIVKSGAGQS